MNALHIVFRTSRFNLSKVGAHFINPCCFGEDLAAWLRDKLGGKGIEAREPHQEDWGWELAVTSGGQSYYLGVGGNADGSAENRDEGEWRVIVEKKRSIVQRFSGQGMITSNDELLLSLKEVLVADATIRDVHVEDV
ncbi:MAG: hypothetical protein ABSB14_22525 [Candidatus Sulfotelmatobacter sp.]|jgi:hypothetical protein